MGDFYFDSMVFALKAIRCVSYSFALLSRSYPLISALGLLYVMVDFALGGGWPIGISSPTYMYVDYIRVYSP